MTAEDSLDRLLSGIVAGDTAAVRGAYHPDARIWHNFDQVEQTVDENLTTLSWFVRALPDRRYEDVVRDQEGQTRRMLDYLGLEFEEQCLRFYETERAINTASSEQVRQPIYTKALNFWRN